MLRGRVDESLGGDGKARNVEILASVILGVGVKTKFENKNAVCFSSVRKL